MGTGIALFWWENGILCTGIRIHQQKNNRKWEWDYDLSKAAHCENGISAMGRWDLVKIWAGKWEWDDFPLQNLHDCGKYILILDIITFDGTENTHVAGI